MRGIFRSRGRASLAVVSLMCTTLLASACSSEDESPPPSKNEFSLRDDVKVATAEQAEAAVVLPDRITFPLAIAGELRALAAGQVLVGDRHPRGASTNRYGFARRVASADVEGESLVVRTAAEDVTLEDIFAKADFKQSFGLDDLYELPPLQSSAAPIPSQLHPQGLELSKRLEASFGKDFGPLDVKEFTIFDRDIDVNGQKVKATLEGKLSLAQAKFVFTPRVDIDLVLGGIFPSTLDRFLLRFKGKTDVAVVADLEATLSLGTKAQEDLTDPDLADKIERQLTDAAASYQLPELLDLETPGPFLGVVPTTFEFTTTVACALGAKGSLTMSAGARATSELTLGIDYTKDKGWSPITGISFEPEWIGPDFKKASATVSIKCGLIPKIAWKVAGISGPFLSLEGGAKTTLSYKETCPQPPFPSNKADGRIKLDGELYAKATVGGQIRVLGHTVKEIQADLFDQSFSVGSSEIDFQDQYSLAWCPVPKDGGSDAADDGASTDATTDDAAGEAGSNDASTDASIDDAADAGADGGADAATDAQDASIMDASGDAQDAGPLCGFPALVSTPPNVVFHCDENVGPSCNALPLALTLSNASWATGPSGCMSGLSFNGTNASASSASDSLYDMQSAMTVAAWVQLDTVKPTGEVGIISRYDTNAQKGWLLGVHALGRPYLKVINGGSFAMCAVNTVMTDGKWHHLAASYGPDGTKLYIDGNFDQWCTNYGQQSALTNAGPLVLGVFNSGYFKGAIDEVTLYPDAVVPTP